MLVTLIVWIFVFLSSYIFGLFTVNFFGSIAKAKLVFPTAFVSIIGLVTFTVFLSYCAFFIGMNNFGLQIGVFLATLFGLFYYKNEFGFLFIRLRTKWVEAASVQKFFLLVFSLFILIKSSGEVQSLDSGTYHLPFIKWVEYYPLIKGLANVHSRFGFNYHYHLLYGFFGFSNLIGTTQHSLNGYMYMMGLVYFYQLFTRYNQKLVFQIASIIALLYISQINKGMTGFSPDFPVAIIQMIIVFECWQYAMLRNNNELNELEKTSFTLIIFWLTMGTITLKLASVSIVFILFIVMFRTLFKTKIIVSLILFSILIFTPYFLRNYTMSGYLIYPFYSIDIFNVFWKVPLQKAIEEKVLIKNWALGYDDYFQGAYHYNWALFKRWINRLPELNKAYTPVVFVLISCFFYTFVKWIFLLLNNAKEKLFKSATQQVILGLVFGLVFWFYNAPDLRFGNGIILPFIAIVFAQVCIKLKLESRMPFISNLFAIVLIASCIFSLFGIAVSHPDQQSNEVKIAWIKQAPYPKPDTVSLKIDGTPLFKNSNAITGKCWDCPPPCSFPSYKYRFIEPGKIEKGFKPDNGL
jgi:hypothetical protein